MENFHSKIIKCAYEICAFNHCGECHAIAITVGGPEPDCDTFANFIDKGGVDETGEVGACKVITCRYNSRLECLALGIQVGIVSGRAKCMTFKKK